MNYLEAMTWMMEQNDAAILFNTFDKFDDYSGLPDGKRGCVIVVELPDRRVASFPMWDAAEKPDPDVIAEWITAVRNQVEALAA